MIEHPCGALPVTGVSVSLWYCHHHQAWFGLAYGYTQDGAQTETAAEPLRIEFGPFDTPADVTAWGESALRALLATAPHPGMAAEPRSG